MNAWRLSKHLIVLALVGLMVGGCVFWSSRVRERQREYERQRLERDDQAWKEMVDRVITGQSDLIYLPYGPRDVDRRLRDVEQLTGLRVLDIEGGDMTARGLASVAKIPNLRELRLYGGAWLGNQDFEILAGKTSIERLELTYMGPHHEPLPALARLPNLRELTIFDRVPREGPCLTEDAWYWLKGLQQLKQLTIGGAGVTDDCVRHLREALPHVSIERLQKEPSVR